MSFMKNAIILHGGPTKEEYYDPESPSMSNSHWIPWLQSQLLKLDISASTPEVPHSYNRDWEVWSREVERYEISPETALIGHSTGAGFFVKYLSVHKKLKVGKIILVAPWIDPEKQLTTGFFDDYVIDVDLAARTKGIVVFNSDNDEDSVQKSAKIILENIKNIQYREFHNYGHFCIEDMATLEFPELLREILK